MHKTLGLILACSSMVVFGSSLPVRDNGDVALTLSEGNYNRIVVKNDKIMEAVFPPNAMGIKRDEQDGSVYVMLSGTNPFTLFLSTEAGRHFSVTVNSEVSLGKTIELVPQQTIAKTISKKPSVPQAITQMLEFMKQHKPLRDVVVRRQFGTLERWSKGLVLKPKESWNSKDLDLRGESIELYNGGKETLQLSETWFATDKTLAIAFSKPTILPKEHAMLYRVLDVRHG